MNTDCDLLLHPCPEILVNFCHFVYFGHLFRDPIASTIDGGHVDKLLRHHRRKQWRIDRPCPKLIKSDFYSTIWLSAQDRSKALPNLEPSIDGYRALLDQGRAAVQGQLRRNPDDSQLRSALEQYRQGYAMIDAMTAAEKKSPLDAIDSVGIRRIAKASDARDQDVKLFLFSYRDYCEQTLRINHG